MNLFDLRHVLRRLLRAPGFSALSILLLGLAFGALACVSSVVYGLLYKPLPFPHSERLVSIESRVLGIPFNVGLSTPLREEIAREARTLDGVAAYRTSEVVQRNEDGSRAGSLRTALVEPGLFGLFGTQAVLGRLFADEDAAPGAARNVLLSWDEWQQRYDGSKDAIGKTLRLDDGEYRIVGVVPKSFVFPSNRTRLWLPLGFSAEERDRSRTGNFDGTMVLGRLGTGAGHAAAADELTRIAEAMPELKGTFGGSLRLRVEPIRALWIGERRGALLLMLLAVSMVWLVTAANVANLFLARSLARRQESALTAALGATLRRRARMAVAEAALLCGAALVLGGAMLPGGLALLRRFDLLPLGTPQAIGVDAPTFALLLVLAAALCAVLVATGLSAQRGNLNDMIRSGGTRQTASGAAQAARRSLVVAQVALTVALLFGIGVLLRSSQNLLAENVGFQRDHLLYASLDDLVPAGATPELRTARLSGFAERVRTLPGVAAAGLGTMIPFGTSIATVNFMPPGQDGIKEQPIGYDQKVDAGYFAALGVPIRRGRDFDADEVRSRAPVAIVDELFVTRHFGDADPIGRHFKVGAGAGLPDREVTVVGVVPTLKQRSLDESPDRASIYQPDPAPPHAALAIRASVDPLGLVAPVKAAAADIAPKEAVGPIVLLDERIADTLRDRERLNTLLGLLGATALLLTGVGLYAVLAYAVRQRMPEFGVRMALGAQAARVLREVLAHGLRLIVAGVLLGLPLAYAFARLLSERLYRIGAFDLPTLAAVAATLVAIGVAACWLPARRAARVDPVLALRDE
ncbi:ADOP family duplicated permease [Dokdonella sp.]|uniref:ADOP family duplicated permease n=1 Tax=Dokdonella sp. TaxID=2291710 RepID=UPI0026354053|nr:ADOP family duplicated permease [Dokdonella sp.]